MMEGESDKNCRSIRPVGPVGKRAAWLDNEPRPLRRVYLTSLSCMLAQLTRPHVKVYLLLQKHIVR